MCVCVCVPRAPSAMCFQKRGRKRCACVHVPDAGQLTKTDQLSSANWLSLFRSRDKQLNVAESGPAFGGVIAAGKPK